MAEQKKETKKVPKKTTAKKPLKKEEGFAVIETGGKQYVVHGGDMLTIEKLTKPSRGNTVAFDKVLLFSDGKKVDIGDPYIKGKKISADFVEEGRGKKVTVLKFKNKIRYLIKRGHRQFYTKVKIASLAK